MVNCLNRVGQTSTTGARSRRSAAGAESRTETVRRAEPAPTDAELERGILDAAKLGALDVARALTARLMGRAPGQPCKVRPPGLLIAAMRAQDTSPAAHDLQMRLYRAMTASARGELALRMSDDIRRIAAEGIRQRHPEYSEHEVRRALLALLYGADAAARVWPRLPVPRP
jgi:hypothetical protein